MMGIFRIIIAQEKKRLLVLEEKYKEKGKIIPFSLVT
jgi:hypothetical protein